MADLNDWHQDLRRKDSWEDSNTYGHQVKLFEILTALRRQ